MDIFKNRNRQHLQTAINKAKMYDQTRVSEVNKDGVRSNSTQSYNFLNKPSQVKKIEIKLLN